MKTLLITGVSSLLGHRLAETPTEDLGKVMAFNLWANQRLLAQFFGSRGASQVVGISSGAAIKGHRGWGGYWLWNQTITWKAL